MEDKRPHIVIIGAGFAGLNATRSLAKLPVDITLIDRKNHHTFQPLLYQVAMAVLSPAEIATPIRKIFERKKNVTVILGEAVGFDLAGRKVKLKDTQVTLSYDYLIVAAGAGHAYFGHDEWQPLAPGLKTIENALEIRRRILLAFEQAERRAAAGMAVAPLNFVIIGGGATGVELAGAMADIAEKALAHDFRYIDPRQSRVVLLEGGPRVLASYPADLSASAEKQLKELGVEVRTNTTVTSVEEGQVRIGDEVLPAAVIMWAAGVAASPLGAKLAEASGKNAHVSFANVGHPGDVGGHASSANVGHLTNASSWEVKIDHAGRVAVTNDLSIPGHRNVFVVGDLAAYFDQDGKPIPGVAPAAIQMGRFVSKMISADLAREPRKTFHYFDKGSLATIGRSRAVGMVGGLHFSGTIAWLAWLFIHLAYLIGFRNRFFVMLEWGWTYFTYQQGARLITDKE